MMRQQYYYFISSLKELDFDMDRPPYNLSDFLGSVKELVTIDDYELIKILLLKFDNNNLLKQLGGKKGDYEYSAFSQEQLEEGIKDANILPVYIRSFLESYKASDKKSSLLSLEDELTLLYYKYVFSSGTAFMSKYFYFDSVLRNVVSAVNAKKYNYQLEKVILPFDDDIYKQLVSSNASDFGLSTRYPWVVELVSLLQKESLVEMEKSIDRIRFNKIDELLFFDTFSVDNIIAYFIKLELISKWYILNNSNGKEIFNGKLDVLTLNRDYLKVFEKGV